MEGNGVNVQIIVEDRLGQKNVYNGKVVGFTPDGRAIAIYTEGPYKTMFTHVQLANLRAILDGNASD